MSAACPKLATSLALKKMSEDLSYIKKSLDTLR